MTDNIYLFVPNLIGYARIAMLFISFYFTQTNYVVAVSCYLISFVLDELDGITARSFNQCSRFGANLDLVTDLCANMCLQVVLSHFYPRWMFIFQLITVLDISSHWIHFFMATLKGKCHKDIDHSRNPIVRIYYTKGVVLSFMCMGNEVFYSMLYLMYFTQGPIVPVLGMGLWKVLCVLSFPVAVGKSGVSFVLLFEATRNIVSIDIEERQQAVKSK